MTKAHGFWNWLWLALAIGSLASVSSCGGTSTSGEKDPGITAGSGAVTTGGTPVDSGGMAVAAGGSSSNDAGAGGGSPAASNGGDPAGGAGGAEACETPGAPGCFSCCEPLVCPANTADCDADPNDCETAFGAENGCTPELATVAVPSYGIPTVNADGSYFVAGLFYEATDFDPGPAEDIRTPASAPDDDGYVTKFSASGDYLWTYTFGRRVYAFNTASGVDGGAVVAGSFVRAIDPDPDSGRIYTDAFITRLGADGQLVWQHAFNAISGDASGTARVATDGDGDAILSASFSGEIDFDLGQGVDARQFNRAEQSYFFEFDAAGSVVWTRAINGENCYLSIQDLAISRETIAVRAFVGIDCVIDGQSLRLPSSHHLPLLAFTREGALRDAWLLGGLNFITGLLAYDDGSVVATGAFTNEMRLGDPGTVIASESTGGADFMLRFSKDSRLQWLKVFPVAGRLGHTIARTPEDGVLGALSPDGGVTSERYLVSWRADGTAAWRGGLGCTATPRIASNGDWFMLKTDDFGRGACDLEPGSSSEPADGTPYLVRYHF